MNGCTRVSKKPIDWIWADNLASMGTGLWVY
jgi:hypothetical protein